MEYGMEDFRYGMEMEWKKIASMEHGKIVFHSIPYHALVIVRGITFELYLLNSLPCTHPLFQSSNC